MKKYFEYLGLIVFALFSFYYTEKVTKIMNSKDPVMKQIKDYKSTNEVSCTEGYITSDGVVLGVSGKIVDIDESYTSMQGSGFDESLLVFKKDECKVNLETTKDNYIIKGNEKKNSISIFIELSDMELINNIIEKTSIKSTPINIITTGKMMEENKDTFKDLSKKGYEIIYGGTNKEDFKKYINIMNELKANKYCINVEDNDILPMCKKENINSLKAKKIYRKDILRNTQRELKKGEFYIYKENANTLKEISATINYIDGKQIQILKITDLLS